MKNLLLALALLGAGGALVPARAAVTPASPPNRATAEAVAARIARDYTVDATRDPLAAALRTNAAAGRYDGLEPEALARRLTDDMAAIAHDKHLGLRHAPDEAAMLAAAADQNPGQGQGQADDAPPSPEMQRLMARQNYGLRELRLLPGNVRYLACDGFAYDGETSDRAVAAAMRFLADADAVVIDLRRNGGGDPEAVATLASYFLPPETPLARFEMRHRPPQRSATHAVPFSLAGKPLYVLTSAATVSAAEEFATHVQAFRLGTLVGATTAGGAYRNETVALDGGYVLSVSIGRPVHARTGGDWEAKGVSPDLPVDPGVALEAAQGAALTALATAAGTTGPRRAEVERLAAFYAAQVAPPALVRPATAYVGRYGERVVALDRHGELTIQRDGGRQGALLPLGGDRFALALDPATQVVFETQGERVTGFAFSRADGTVVRATRQ